jgi:hypothetical protein
MPSTDRKLELEAKTSMAQTASQAAVYAKGLNGYLGPFRGVKEVAALNSLLAAI